jgi:hypothetical protein
MHPLKKLNALLPLLGVSFNPRIEWRDREGAIRRLHMNDIQTMARLTTRRSPISQPNCQGTGLAQLINFRDKKHRWSSTLSLLHLQRTWRPSIFFSRIRPVIPFPYITLLPNKTLIDSLHGFRFAGNDAAHDLEAMYPSEAAEALEVMEDLLNFL